MPDVTTLTERFRETQNVLEAMRFLSLAAVQRISIPEVIAQQFVETYPKALATPGLRKALLDGELLEKAVAPAGTDVPAYAGALLPPALLGPLVSRIQQAAVLARIPGLQHVPVNISIPYESAAPSLKWVGQGKPKPVSNITLASVTLTLYKFSGILVQTSELAKSTRNGSDAVLARSLVNASTTFLDQQLLSPAVAAVADQNPKSLTNGLTPVTPGATPDETVAAVVAAFYTQRPNPIARTFVLSPAVAMKSRAVASIPAC